MKELRDIEELDHRNDLKIKIDECEGNEDHIQDNGYC